MSVMTMLYTIANVKISLKTSSIVLDNVVELATRKQLQFKAYPNFIVIKDIYTFTVFKGNKTDENHINITKIPNCDKIQDAVKYFQELFSCCVRNITVDNIIATTYFKNKNIDLYKISKAGTFASLKYNNESFPGANFINKL